ncbi:MAG: 2-isopropylmalate synthase [Chloroflexi bacterium]|nr:2-isopropylmalate synthase [Chloroflexota bacterium]
MDRVIIFDTTLRDGEQAAGGSLTITEKLEIGHQLEKLGVDIIEAGFPHTSPGDFLAVELLSKELKNCRIAALSGFRREQIDSTWAALKGAINPLLHIVISTSDIHLNQQLHLSRDEVLKLTLDAVSYAKKFCSEIEFSAMDATRSDRDFLCKVLQVAVANGATVINVPDTVGYAQPDEFGRLITYVREHVQGIEKVVLSVHCHDDLGQAVANSLRAIENGARQVECTMNGVGERAGNASLEEIVMSLIVRKDFYNIVTRIDPVQIYRTSRMVSNYMGMVVPPNKAVVGANAFAHASGLHQDGMLKDRATYEIMTPKSIGVYDSRIVLGKTSGRHAVRDRLEKIGYNLSDVEFERAFLAFKELADKKKEVDDRDIEAIIADELRMVSETYHLEHVQVSCGEPTVPTASVKLTDSEGKLLADAALGTGPVDAIYKAINRLIQVPNKLTEFSVKSVTEGIDAIGEVTIKVESNGKTYIGKGTSTDIIVASAKAYMNALNRLLASKKDAQGGSA